MNPNPDNNETIILKIVEQYINTHIKIHDLCMIFNLRQDHNEIITLKTVEQLINTHRKVHGTGLKRISNTLA